MTTTTLTPKIVRRYPKEPVVVRCHPHPEQLAELREMMAGEPCLGCGQRFTAALRLTAFDYSDRYVVALQPMGDLGGRREAEVAEQLEATCLVGEGLADRRGSLDRTAQSPHLSNLRSRVSPGAIKAG